MVEIGRSLDSGPTRRWRSDTGAQHAHEIHSLASQLQVTIILATYFIHIEYARKIKEMN